jgi:hypothetical protein
MVASGLSRSGLAWRRNGCSLLGRADPQYRQRQGPCVPQWRPSESSLLTPGRLQEPSTADRERVEVKRSEAEPAIVEVGSPNQPSFSAFKRWAD